MKYGKQSYNRHMHNNRLLQKKRIIIQNKIREKLLHKTRSMYVSTCKYGTHSPLGFNVVRIGGSLVKKGFTVPPRDEGREVIPASNRVRTLRTFVINMGWSNTRFLTGSLSFSPLGLTFCAALDFLADFDEFARGNRYRIVNCVCESVIALFLPHVGTNCKSPRMAF
jgi:hypothetical protein